MTVQTQKTSSKPGIFSVRNRLLAVVFLALVVPVVITQIVGVTTTQAALKKQVDQGFYNLAFSSSEALANALVGQIGVLQTIASSSTFRSVIAAQNIAYEDDPDAIQAVLLANDEIWRAADQADDNTEPLVNDRLTNLASVHLRAFKERFPDNVELFLTDKYGGLVAATDRTSDYYQGDEGWWLAAWNRGQGAVYIDNEISYDASSGTYSIIMAVPVFEVGEPIGILRSTYNAATLQALVSQIRFGETGHTVVFNHLGQVVTKKDFDPANPETLPAIVPLLNKFYNALDGELDVITDETGARSIVASTLLTSHGVVPAVEALQWYVSIHQEEDEVFKPITDSLSTTLRTAAIVLGLGLLVGYGLTLTITRPLNKLTAAAQQLIASEDLSVRATVTGRNEFGILGRTFNTMMERLQDLFATLEERVADRTRDLAAVAEVSAQTSTILDVQQLLLAVCNLTKERFNLYHAHIYLLDQSGEDLVLAAGAGEPGRQMVAARHHIPLSREQSLVARAARSRGVVSVDNVSAAPDFLPNPLLPDTRSELAVALVARGQLLGVLDVQSDELAHFGPEIQTVMETLARQVAAALSNVQLFSEVDRISRHEQALGAITQSIQAAVKLEEVLQVATRELGKALRVPHTAIELQLRPAVDDHAPGAVRELGEAEPVEP